MEREGTQREWEMEHTCMHWTGIVSPQKQMPTDGWTQCPERQSLSSPQPKSIPPGSPLSTGGPLSGCTHFSAARLPLEAPSEPCCRADAKRSLRLQREAQCFSLPYAEHFSTELICSTPVPPSPPALQRVSIIAHFHVILQQIKC